MEPRIVLEDMSKPTDEISALIKREFGFWPRAFVMSRTEFEEAILNNPYGPDGGKTVHLFFCNKVPTCVDYALLKSLNTDWEDYALIENVFYLHAPDSIGRSTLVQKMGKAFAGVEMTARNPNTISKLAQMLDRRAI